MSKKDSYLELLKEARIEHKKWINQVKLIVSGLEKSKSTIVLNPSESPFGRWFYAQAMECPITNSDLILSDMELFFHKCYEEYHKIHALLFKDSNGGILESLFGSTKASLSDYKIASELYETLLENSEKLLRKLRAYENQLIATNSQKFDRAILDDTVSESREQNELQEKEKRYYRGSLITD